MGFWVLAVLGLSLTDAPVVSNPLGEKDSLVVLRFEEDLQINPNDAEDHLQWFGSRVMVDVNSRGEMFVLDAGNHRVVRLAPDGSLAGLIGREGSGPGEFKALHNLRVTNDDFLLVYESRMGFATFTIFDTEGNFVAQEQPISPPRLLQAVQITPDGLHVNAMYAAFVRGKGMIAATALLSRGPKKLDLKTVYIRQQLEPFNPVKANDPIWWQKYLSQWFRVASRQNVMAFNRDGNAYLAYTDAYRIQRLNKGFEPTLTIEKEYKPRYRSEDEFKALIEPMQTELMSTIAADYHRFLSEPIIAKALADAEFPARKPPVYGMEVLGNGDVLVIHDYNLESKKGTGHVFRSDGHFLGRADLPPMSVNLFGAYLGQFAKIAVRGTFAYVLETDPEENIRLTRYRLFRENGDQ